MPRFRSRAPIVQAAARAAAESDGRRLADEILSAIAPITHEARAEES